VREIKAIRRHGYLEGCSLVWDKVRLSNRSGLGGSCTGSRRVTVRGWQRVAVLGMGTGR
jgi:hypothetical protein